MPIYACTLCTKTFTKPCRLERHCLSHSGVKPFNCLYINCSKSFTRPDHLSRHIVAEHTGERRWHCEFPGCEAKFYEQSHFTRHRSVHTEAVDRKKSSSAQRPHHALSRKRMRALSVESDAEYACSGQKEAGINPRSRRVGALQRKRGLAAGALLALTCDLPVSLSLHVSPFEQPSHSSQTAACNESVAALPSASSTHVFPVFPISGRLSVLPDVVDSDKLQPCLANFSRSRSRAHSLSAPVDPLFRPHTPSAYLFDASADVVESRGGSYVSRPSRCFPAEAAGVDDFDLAADLGPDLCLRDASLSAGDDDTSSSCDPGDPFLGPAAIVCRVSPTALAYSAPGLLSQLALSCPMPRCCQAFQHRLHWRNHIRTAHAGEMLVCPEREVCGGRSFKYVKQWEKHVTACRFAGQAARVQANLLVQPGMASSFAVIPTALSASVACVAGIVHSACESSIAPVTAAVNSRPGHEASDDDLSDFLHAALGLPPIAR